MKSWENRNYKIILKINSSSIFWVSVVRRAFHFTESIDKILCNTVFRSVVLAWFTGSYDITGQNNWLIFRWTVLVTIGVARNVNFGFTPRFRFILTKSYKKQTTSINQFNTRRFSLTLEFFFHSLCRVWSRHLVQRFGGNRLLNKGVYIRNGIIDSICYGDVTFQTFVSIHKMIGLEYHFHQANPPRQRTIETHHAKCIPTDTTNRMFTSHINKGPNMDYDSISFRCPGIRKRKHLSVTTSINNDIHRKPCPF